MSEARPTLAVGVCYQDPRAALAWLERAFGFETTMVVEGDDGSLAHSEMRAGRNGLIMVGREWDDFHKSPLALGGINTQSIHIHLEPGEDIDGHFARAIDAGARRLRDPADQFYGDRVYGVVDPEGHQWTFSVPVKAMSQAEMAQAGGVTVKGSL